MTDEEFAGVQAVIGMAQRIHTSAHKRLCEKGVQPADTLIASVYAAHQLAATLHGNPFAAVEWMRDTVDTIERQLLEASARG